MIVAVCGGKGGVGKTTIAFTLGRELDAVVVDGDVVTPNQQYITGPTLHDVLAGRVSPDEAVRRIGSIRCLPSGGTVAGAIGCDLEELPRSVEHLERRYGVVVIDCPSGLARDVGITLSCADVSVLVTTPTRSALLDAYRTRALALDLDTPIASVVLNSAARAPEVTDIAERIEYRFGAPTTIIEERAAIASAERRAIPIEEMEDTAAGAPDADSNTDRRIADSIRRIVKTIERSKSVNAYSRSV